MMRRWLSLLLVLSCFQSIVYSLDQAEFLREVQKLLRDARPIAPQRKGRELAQTPPTQGYVPQRGPAGAASGEISEGDVCNIQAYPVPAETSESFLACLRPSNDNGEWPWSDIGLWVKQSCKAGREFSIEERICKTKPKIRRQQAWPYPVPYSGPPPGPPPPVYPVPGPGPSPFAGPLLPPGPGIFAAAPPPLGPPVPPPFPPPLNPFTIPTPCPIAPEGAVSAVPGAICSWMLAPLAVDPGTPFGYLQCIPASPGLYCGRWLPRPCAAGTRFEVVAQGCVHAENAAPIVPIAALSSGPFGPLGPGPLAAPPPYPWKEKISKKKKKQSKKTQRSVAAVKKE